MNRGKKISFVLMLFSAAGYTILNKLGSESYIFALDPVALQIIKIICIAGTCGLVFVRGKA